MRNHATATLVFLTAQEAARAVDLQESLTPRNAFSVHRNVLLQNFRNQINKIYHIFRSAQWSIEIDFEIYWNFWNNFARVNDFKTRLFCQNNCFC